MMEKYGVDLSEIPADDDQIRVLRTLCKEANQDFEMPKNKKHAEEMIEKLANVKE